MNNKRRKVIADIRSRLEQLVIELSEVLEDEETYFENMPEGIAASSKGTIAEENIGTLEEAKSE